MAEQVLDRFGAGDEFAIVLFQESHREQSMEVLRKSFFLHETVCVGAEVDLCPQAQRDLEQLCEEVADGGVTLLAKHLPTDRIVGVSFNVLQTPAAPGDLNYFEFFRDNKCTVDASRSLMQFMITMDSKVNLFELRNVDCLLEIMFLATLPEFEGRGIATKLVEQSVVLAKGIKYGDSKLQLPRSVLDKKPQLVSALFTSRISQRVGQKNGFTEMNEVPHSEFVYNGKPYSERIGPEHPSSKLVMKAV